MWHDCADQDEIFNFHHCWNTDKPAECQCFEKTLLVWIPCGLVFLLLPFYICNSRKSRNVGACWFCCFKKGLLMMIFLLSLIRLIGTVWIQMQKYGTVDLIVVLSIALMSECLLILLLSTIYLSSMLGAVNLLAYCIFMIPELRSKIMIIHEANYQDLIFDIIIFMIMYICTCIATLIFVFGRHNGQCDKSSLLKDTNSWPDENASFISQLYFGYMWKIFFKGYKGNMQLSDVWNVDHTDEAANVCTQFMQTYDRIRHKYKYIPGRTLALTAFAIHWRLYLASICMIFVREIAVFIILLDMRWLIEMSSTPEEPRWHGTVYVIIYFICDLCRTLCMEHNSYNLTRIGIRLRSAIASFVLKKSFRLSPSAKKEFGPGAISNLSSVDAGQFLESSKLINLIWSVPLVFCFGTYLLYISVGHACWLGPGIFTVSLTINFVCSRYYMKLFGQEMMEKDKRIKILAEILRIIRVVKYYAWEFAFKKLVDNVRQREIKLIKQWFYVYAVTDTIFSTSIIALTAIFATFTFGMGGTLKPDIAFTVPVVLFQINMLAMVRVAITGLATIMTSFRRLDKYFDSEESENYIDHHTPDGITDSAVIVNNGQFGWDQESHFQLDEINVEIKKGQLVAVVGAVGSGKSSFLNAIAGEMYRKNGTIKVLGTMAYVPQQSWILNDTVRGNVTFTKQFHHEHYENVITACALKMDVDSFPAGDMTEIGERGITLSGGQKHRVSLARAVYEDRDIYLLDDPLSAVDVRVQSQIFDQVIGPNGLLKAKTRIFVTNALMYLPMCDMILVMDQGKIIQIGTFEDVAVKCAGLFKYFKQRKSKDENDSSEEEVKESIMHQVKQESGRLVAPEAIATGTVTWGSYWFYMKSAGWSLISFFFWLLASKSYPVLSLIQVQQWTDNVMLAKNATEEYQANIRAVTGLSIITAIQIPIWIFFIYFTGQFAANASKSIHDRLLHRVLMAPITLFDCTPSGRFLNRFSQDIQTIDRLPVSIYLAYVWTLIFVSKVVPIIYATPILAALFIPFTVLLLVMQKFYITSARQLQRLEAISRSPVFSRLHDILQGQDSIRIYEIQDIFASKFQRLVDAHAAARLCLATSVSWLSVHANTLAIITSSFAILLALYTSTTPGLFGLSLASIVMISTTAQLIQLMCETEKNFVAVERVKEYLHLPQEASYTTSQMVPMIGKTEKRNLAELPSSGEIACLLPYTLDGWPKSGVVEFKNYSLRYRSDLPLALKGINLKINQGEKIGIVGRTGAGKTSITAGLFRLIEAAEGQILIDSVDISTIGLHELRRKLTIIPQDPSVFSGTIRQNVDPFDEYSDDDIWLALESSHLKAYVTNLPNGIGHKLDEGGCNLSMGQRQLLCLARALLRRTKILVLDEATASVDMETDNLIQDAIRIQFAECTVITIAHRLETIMDCDSVILLSDGQILEHGQTKTLLHDPESNFSRFASGKDLHQ